MYVNVVARVREAFETEEVIRLDCTHVGTSDCKRISAKLRVLLLFSLCFCCLQEFLVEMLMFFNPILIFWVYFLFPVNVGLGSLCTYFVRG